MAVILNTCWACNDDVMKPSTHSAVLARIDFSEGLLDRRDIGVVAWVKHVFGHTNNLTLQRRSFTPAHLVRRYDLP